MAEAMKTLCPWCGEDDHKDWCPDNKGLRQETHGLPSYMKSRKPVDDK